MKAQLNSDVIYYMDGNPDGEGMAAKVVEVSKFAEIGPVSLFIYPTPNRAISKPIRSVRHHEDPYLNNHPEDRVINGDNGGVWDTPDNHEIRRCNRLTRKKLSANKQEDAQKKQDEINVRRKEEDLISGQVVELYANGQTVSEIASKMKKPTELIKRILAQYSAEYQKSNAPEEPEEEPVVDETPDPWASAPARAVGNAPNSIPSGINTLADNHGPIGELAGEGKEDLTVTK